MPWTYTFHRFEDKASYEAARDECEKFTSPMYDVIGTIYKETGVTLTTEEGEDYPETVALDGFHVNMAWPGEAAPSFTESQIQPVTPYREFLKGE